MNAQLASECKRLVRFGAMPKRSPAWTDADYDRAGYARVSLHLRKETAELLKRLAKGRGVSRTVVIEELINGQKLRTPPPAIMRAQQAILRTMGTTAKLWDELSADIEREIAELDDREALVTRRG